MKTSRIISITPKFSAKQFQLVLAQKMQRIEAAILNRLIRVGEKFVANARSTNTYKDQTGNLRSSIGYIVMKNGEQMASSFPGLASAGNLAGSTAAEKIARRHKRGFALIVVAGMDYALAVESRGLDVLTGSSQIAEADLRSAIKEIQDKASRKI